ncbi:hypothetical protein QBC41DRAFT_237256 [Cercophora samala]|uniref:DUF6546 domain-containing protein n=1 Tax=Cercophora samala TaxID=330535 RepID=A0AA39YWF3_9PEZI|nr:hypothetical protein QBC41DRAFT_237256 [Cercophora samala]
MLRRSHRLAKKVGSSFRWGSLPAEIRCTILEVIMGEKYPGCGWGSLASVCKEWQSVVERKNFARLNLREHSLGRFQSEQPVRCRNLLRHICLDIEIRNYTCGSCGREEYAEYSTSMIRPVLNFGLAFLTGFKEAKDLTLELNIYSPSDPDHWFHHWHFGSRNQRPPQAIDCARRHDPKHGWVRGRQVAPPPCTATMRLFEQVELDVQFIKYRLDNITCFVLQRQVRRQIEHVWRLIRKLDCLEHLIYEPWRPWSNGQRRKRDEELIILVSQCLPSSLKKVSVFEDFSDEVVASLGDSLDTNRQRMYLVMPGDNLVTPSRVVTPQVGAEFAARSLPLEALSVSFMINAEDFFDACQPTWMWPQLESLALTSQRLTETGSRQGIEALLIAAGVAALRMPKLRSMAIWNGGKGNACAFIYRTEGLCASISWSGTWDMDLSGDVVAVWRRVAYEGPLRHVLQVKKVKVEAVIESHGDAIHYLELPCQVATPESVWQIRREGSIKRT